MRALYACLYAHGACMGVSVLPMYDLRNSNRRLTKTHGIKNPENIINGKSNGMIIWGGGGLV